jgi:hypothetical protein
MRFLIFGNEKTSEFTVKDLNSFYESEDLDKAMEAFNRANKALIFKYSYLIADFGMGNHKNAGHLFNKYADCDTRDMQIPFLIIAQFNSDKDAEFSDKTVRTDKIEIVGEGFKHEFHDNLAAVKMFENVMCAGDISDATMFITYRYYTGQFRDDNGKEKVIGEIKRRVANKHVVRALNMLPEEEKYNIKYHLKEVNWINIPVEKNRNLCIFTLDNPNKSKIKDIDMIDISKKKVVEA